MNNNIKAVYKSNSLCNLISFIQPYSLTGSFKTLSGDKIYFLNGKLHRVDGPAVECVGGTKLCYFNGKLHREDGPAIEYASGTKHWFLNGKRHRVDGPAIEYTSGTKHWYLNGKEYTEEEFNKKIKGRYNDKENI